MLFHLNKEKIKKFHISIQYNMDFVINPQKYGTKLIQLMTEFSFYYVEMEFFTQYQKMSASFIRKF